MTAVFILLAIGLLLVSWVVGAYNRIARARKRFIKAFTQVDQQLKRRHEAIPGLVEIAKAYLKQERAVLEALVAARNEAVIACAKTALDPSDGSEVRRLAAAENLLSGALVNLFALSDAHPDMHVDQNMKQHKQELAGIASGIAYASQSYDEAVRRYNTSLGQFPASVIANMFAFSPAQTLELA